MQEHMSEQETIAAAEARAAEARAAEARVAEARAVRDRTIGIIFLLFAIAAGAYITMNLDDGAKDL